MSGIPTVVVRTLITVILAAITIMATILAWADYSSVWYLDSEVTSTRHKMPHVSGNPCIRGHPNALPRAHRTIASCL